MSVRLKPIALLPALALTGCIHLVSAPKLTAPAPAKGGSVLIEDVRVFDANDGRPEVREHLDVRIVGGVIADIRPSVSPHLPADLVIPGDGRTLLPGLIDLHVHLALGAGPPWFLTLPDPKHAAQSLVYSGVTSVLDLGGDLKTLQRLKGEIAAGGWVGPHIRYAGPGLTVEGGYPLDMAKEVYGSIAYASLKNRDFVAVKDVADVVAQVDRIADGGGTFVKLMGASIPPRPSGQLPAPRLSEELMAAATKRAHERHLKVAAHIDSAEDALICARVGVDLLAHGVETSLLTPEQVATLKASGIAFEPTLVNWHRFDELAVGEFHPTASEIATQPAAVLASLAPAVLLEHERTLTGSSFKGWADALQAHRADRVANTLAMFQAGIPLLVGSDSNGSIGTFPGSIHEELRLLVDAGVPILDVLKAATYGNGTFLDAQASGTLKPGAVADLLLVNGDPTTDIKHTEDIVQVWVSGVPVRSSPPTSP